MITYFLEMEFWNLLTQVPKVQRKIHKKCIFNEIIHRVDFIRMYRQKFTLLFAKAFKLK